MAMAVMVEVREFIPIAADQIIGKHSSLPHKSSKAGEFCALPYREHAVPGLLSLSPAA